MVSGEVKRPTPTTGLRVSLRTNSMIGSWLPSGAKRDGAQSVGEESSFTSHRSGTSASSSTTSWASEGAASLGRERSSSRLIRDRKSTRLNSSHLVISYAVFCLKKKKKEQHRYTYSHV